MIKELRRIISRNIVNWKGWSTDKKIVVFESDDWGSIRMPSRKVYNKLFNQGIRVDKSPYCKYDSLASEKDLDDLFNILSKFQDVNDNPPVITANTVVANPDFKQIKESEFTEYFYEPFTVTLKKYPEHSHSFEKWKSGYESGLFYPQFHGREHVNINLWLKLLRNDSYNFRLAFENEFWGLSKDVYPEMEKSIQATFDMQNESELKLLEQSIMDGLEIFENIFGFKSESFIANNFTWDSILNKTLKDNGVRFLQGMKCQIEPNNNGKEFIRHYVGEKNQFGQIYLVRNCTFEPSLMDSNYNNVEECIKGIRNAFFWKKPAIVSTHRLNFIGYLVNENKSKNLKLLEDLLDEILKRWPEVEFMNSAKLGRLIERDYEN